MTATETPAGPPTRGTRRRADTRRRLMDVAFDVLAEHGIRDTRIELICERAGFTRGAFYSNFGSKEDLFLAMYAEHLHRWCERLQEAIDDVLTTSPPPDTQPLRETVSQVASEIPTALVPDRQWYLLLSEFRAYALRDPELRARTERTQRHYLDRIGEILATMLGRLGITLRVSPQNAVSVLSGIYEKALERALFTESEATADSELVTEVLPEIVTALVATGQ
ncbi:TetR/AcrR family transcriptional regulator [Haloechinothrix sp. LS1_15]|uniref:TetR/AcrR family transcriptional regulator n=1 Tax=Haloechinothrix sp. LS1_15 TaxID=2652248 RepID=UPI00294608D5|nr:TetR/AcrR family transcriptional regulator [Haloechinothrix sp. LS1_15]MDV6012521.1 TetR/AcrR family transcriptional regulator [Haloechinothrix sp. LS1_15]